MPSITSRGASPTMRSHSASTCPATRVPTYVRSVSRQAPEVGTKIESPQQGSQQGPDHSLAACSPRCCCCCSEQAHQHRRKHSASPADARRSPHAIAWKLWAACGSSARCARLGMAEHIASAPRPLTRRRAERAKTRSSRPGFRLPAELLRGMPARSALYVPRWQSIGKIAVYVNGQLVERFRRRGGLERLQPSAPDRCPARTIRP